MKKGDYVRLNEKATLKILKIQGIKEVVAKQLIEELRLQVEDTTAFSIVVKVKNRKVEVLNKYVELAG